MSAEPTRRCPGGAYPGTAIEVPEMVAAGAGRQFRSSRRVRLGDVGPCGRARLDAAARWLQDVAADDLVDAGLEGEAVWVVRRTAMVVARRPRYGEEVHLSTWCSGTGAAWAERRTTLSGQGGAAEGGTALDAVSLWVALEPGGRRPRPLDDRFLDVWGGLARARHVRSRLTHPGPPASATADRPLVLRLADFDLVGHVNNAVAWAVLEEEVDRIRPGARVVSAAVEYPAAITPGTEVTVRTRAGEGSVESWLTGAGGRPLVSMLARLEPAGAEPAAGGGPPV